MALSRNHGYSNVSANGNSRMQNGDIYNNSDNRTRNSNNRTYKNQFEDNRIDNKKNFYNSSRNSSNIHINYSPSFTFMTGQEEASFAQGRQRQDEYQPNSWRGDRGTSPSQQLGHFNADEDENDLYDADEGVEEECYEEEDQNFDLIDGGFQIPPGKAILKRNGWQCPVGKKIFGVTWSPATNQRYWRGDIVVIERICNGRVRFMHPRKGYRFTELVSNLWFSGDEDQIPDDVQIRGRL